MSLDLPEKKIDTWEDDPILAAWRRLQGKPKLIGELFGFPVYELPCPGEDEVIIITAPIEDWGKGIIVKGQEP